MPIGTILPYIGAIANIPSGWALCNGSNGTPNLLGKFLEGVTSVSNIKQMKAAALPNIKGKIHADDIHHPIVSSQEHLITADSVTSEGALSVSSYESVPWYNGHTSSAASGGYETINFNASKSSSIYKDSCTTVQPESYTVFYIMKIK